jgi:hypothetical protein
MSTVRLVNTTTAFRVDATLEDGFFSVIDPLFLDAIERQSRNDNVDVQLARRGPPNAQMDRIPDTDLLGIYVSHHRVTHHPMIRVFPERLLSACEPWRRKMEEEGQILIFAERYPTLLYKVIIHELAHCLMDARAFSRKCCHAGSWTEYMTWLDKDADKGIDAEWDDNPVADSQREKWLQQKRAGQAHECEVGAKSLQCWNDENDGNASGLLRLREQCKIVEESLANALVLRQSFGDDHLLAIRVFMESQSEPYRLGLKWHGDLGLLLDMAATWRGYKAKHIGFGGQAWLKSTPSQQGWLNQLVTSLGTPQGVVLPFFA